MTHRESWRGRDREKVREKGRRGRKQAGNEVPNTSGWELKWSNRSVRLLDCVMLIIPPPLLSEFSPLSLLPSRIYSAYLTRFLSLHFGSLFLYTRFLLFSPPPPRLSLPSIPICLLSMSNHSLRLSVSALSLDEIGCLGLRFLICKSIVISVRQFKLREVLMCPVLFHTGNDKFALEFSLGFLPFSPLTYKTVWKLNSKNVSSNNI